MIYPARHNVARNVRLLRAQRQWTQAQLAKESGVAQTAISYVERGVKSPTVDLVEDLAKAFGLHAWELLTEQQPLQPLPGRDQA